MQSQHPMARARLLALAAPAVAVAMIGFSGVANATVATPPSQAAPGEVPSAKSASETVPARATTATPPTQAAPGGVPVISTDPLQLYAGDPGAGSLDASNTKTTSGASGNSAMSAESSMNCVGAPSQTYDLFPVRGCSLVPADQGWKNEMCVGGNGAYECREVAGHPSLNLAPDTNWEVYKDGMNKFSNYSSTYGMSMVDNGGNQFEGCLGWTQVDPAQHQGHSYLSFCDYKMANSGPLHTVSNASGYFYGVLRNWAYHTATSDAACAASIVGTWNGTNDWSDVGINCDGVFGN